MMQRKKTALISILILSGIGLAYQNCGQVNDQVKIQESQSEPSQTVAFLEKKYEGPSEFSPTETKIEESSEKSEPSSTDEEITDDSVAKSGPTLLPSVSKAIDPCRMDTNGNGVIEKIDQKLLNQMIQNGLTAEQIVQFDINNDGFIDQTEILYYPSHIGAICQKLKQLALNEQSTCAISKSGKVYCWGDGNSGQLGNGQMGSLIPVEIDTSLLGIENKFKQITAGYYYYCGVHDSGKIYCWGKNAFGTLGNGTTVNSNTPVEINMTETGYSNNFKSVIAATHGDYNFSAHTCGIHINGKAFCWGKNESYEFGNGTNTDSLVPTAMDMSAFSSPTILSLSAGRDHTCVIDANKKLYCWGINTSGLLGTGNTTNQTSPIEVNTSTINVANNFKKVSTSWSHTCAIHNNNKLYCWGNSNQGQVGSGSFSSEVLFPTLVAFPSIGFANQIKDVDVGISGTCALNMSNKGFCWGENTWGQVGIGFMGNNYHTPVPVESQPAVAANFIKLYSTHGHHACGINANRKTYCWVDASSGQLGNGTTTLMSSHPMSAVLEVDVTNVQ